MGETKVATPGPRALPWLAVSAGIVVVDHLTKAWALAALSETTTVPVVNPGWNWHLSFNTGAAFSFLSAAGGWQRHVLTVLALGVCALLTCWLARLPRRAWKPALAYSLIIGGALSNAFDRLLRGRVVDFIQWYWRDWYLPTFNLADSAISIGAVLLVLQSMRSDEIA